MLLRALDVDLKADLADLFSSCMLLCRDASRLSQLRALQQQYLENSTSAPLAAVAAQQYMYLQCAPGFTGNLCSRCNLLTGSVAYGKSFTGSCAACLPLLSSAVTYACTRLFEIAIVAALIVVALHSATVRMRHRNQLLHKQHQRYLQKQRRQRAMQHLGLQKLPPQRSSPRLLSFQGQTAVAAAAAADDCEESALEPDDDADGEEDDLDVLGDDVAMGQGPLLTAGCGASDDEAAMLWVVKDYVQVLSIIRVALLHMNRHSTLSYVGGIITFTPLSSLAWVSLDCLMPRTQRVFDLLPSYRLLVTAGMMGAHVVLLLVFWAVYLAVVKRQRWLQQLQADKPKIIVSMLVVVSYFYPSTAVAVLSTFACQAFGVPARHVLEPAAAVQRSSSSTQATAVGWMWSIGTIAILTYPCLQAYLLSRQAKAGGLQPTSLFFVRYGHLVENFRPRLYFWGSVVELRKLALVAVVLGLQSVSSLAQLLGCWVILMVYAWSTQALLPYPYKLLNKLYMATNVALLAFVWLNMLVAAAGSSLGERGVLALQICSLLIAATMLLVLLIFCCRRVQQFARKAFWSLLKQACRRGQATVAAGIRRQWTRCLQSS
eukprot:gene9190-9356_t